MIVCLINRIIVCNEGLQLKGGEYSTKSKILKKIGIMILTVSICTGGTYPVTASSLLENNAGLETVENHAEDTEFSRLRGNNLNYGNASITALASNKVNVSGITQCHHVCDTVYLELYLERKVNGSYATYKSWEFTASDVTSLLKSMDVIVPSGYYYRVRGYHAAKDGTKESTTTLTSGVLVN